MKKYGFTLIELLVVIAIIGLLMAILLPKTFKKDIYSFTGQKKILLVLRMI
ncbi:MAG: prepilin-type N-terminal cleavage/methylation domain-containing protein [Sedimentisphaerales bacterium]